MFEISEKEMRGENAQTHVYISCMRLPEMHFKITFRYAWQPVRECNHLFEWHKLIRHKDTIPRCAFILHVVFKYKLRTMDKLIRLGVATITACVLCGETDETS
ncbi:hypothetical protein LguiA_033409 [Lonicera macranthoides]